MQLIPIHFTANCDNASCPTIYLNEKGNYVIQGFKLDLSKKSDLKIPEGEDMIEVPAVFMEAFLEKQKQP